MKSALLILFCLLIFSCGKIEVMDMANQEVEYPVVTGSSISNLQPDVSLFPNIVVNFSIAIDVYSSSNKVSLSRGGFADVPVSLYWSADRRQISIMPKSILLKDNPYILTVKRELQGVNGCLLTNDYLIRFYATQDLTPPRIVSTSPLDGAKNVASRHKIAVFFSELMNTNTIGIAGSDGTSGAFSLRNSYGQRVPGRISWVGANLFFVPDMELMAYHDYTIQVDTSGKDYAGNPLENVFKSRFVVPARYALRNSIGISRYVLDNPVGVCVVAKDGQEYVFVSCEGNNNIIKYKLNRIPNSPDVSYVLQKIWGGGGTANGKFQSPGAIASDSQGNIYIIDKKNTRIQKFDIDGNFILKWSTYEEGPGYFQPCGLAIDKNDNIFVSGGWNKIHKYNTSGSFITRWSSIKGAIGLGVDSQGSIYAAETEDSQIRKFDNNGNFITNWGHVTNGSSGLWSPFDIAIDGQDKLYVKERGTWLHNRIIKYDSSANYITNWGSTGTAPGYFNFDTDTFHCLSITSNGSLFVVDGLNHRIQKFDSGGTFITEWGSGQLNLTDKEYGEFKFALDGQNNIYIADYRNCRVQALDRTGRFIREWGTWGNNDTNFQYPAAIAVDKDGYVYVCDENMIYYVKKFDAMGNFILKWGGNGYNEDGKFDNFECITLDESGFVYVGDRYGLQKFDAMGNFIARWPIGRVDEVAIDPNGNIYAFNYGWWLTMNVLDPAGNSVTNLVFPYGNGSLQFASSPSVAISDSGAIYILDGSNNRIQIINTNGSLFDIMPLQYNTAGTDLYPAQIRMDKLNNIYTAYIAEFRGRFSIQVYYPQAQ